MANALYGKGKEALLSGSINLVSDTIKAQIVDGADYTVNLSTDDALADIPGGARVGSAVTLTGKSVTLGVFDAADATVSSVTGDQSEILVIYKDTGVEATSLLIAYIDTGTNLPVTPNTGDIAIAWNNGASKIFAI